MLPWSAPKEYFDSRQSSGPNGQASPTPQAFKQGLRIFDSLDGPEPRLANLAPPPTIPSTPLPQ